jgi:hypothetical protein
MTKVDFVKLTTEPATTRELINDLRVSIAEASPGDIPGVLRNLSELHGGKFSLDCDRRGRPRKYPHLLDEARALVRGGRSIPFAARRVAENHDPVNAAKITRALIDYLEAEKHFR